MPFYLSKDGETVDRIVWQHYGRQNERVVETVLEVNPGLAGYGPTLPAGVRIELPEIAREQSTESVRLWG